MNGSFGKRLSRSSTSSGGPLSRRTKLLLIEAPFPTSLDAFSGGVSLRVDAVDTAYVPDDPTLAHVVADPLLFATASAVDGSVAIYCP